MKKNILLLVAALVCLFVFENCNKTKSNMPQNFIVELGSCNVINQVGTPVICFDSLITDCRCPEDVMCPWAGYAAVKLSMKYNNGSVQKFSLSTLPHTQFPPNDTTLNGYHIRLVNVFPYPNTAIPQPDKYRVELQVAY